MDLLWDLFRKIYDQGKMPNAWRESVIIPIYKEKDDIQDCGNYRGVELMSHTLNPQLSRVWLSRFKAIAGTTKNTLNELTRILVELSRPLSRVIISPGCPRDNYVIAPGQTC